MGAFLSSQAKKAAGTASVEDSIKAVYSEWPSEWEKMIDDIDDQCDTIIFSLRSLEGEDIRQNKWMDLDDTYEEDEIKMRLVKAVLGLHVGLDYMKLEDDFFDSIHSIDGLFKQVTEDEAEHFLKTAAEKRRAEFTFDEEEEDDLEEEDEEEDEEEEEEDKDMKKHSLIEFDLPSDEEWVDSESDDNSEAEEAEEEQQRAGSSFGDVEDLKQKDQSLAALQGYPTSSNNPATTQQQVHIRNEPVLTPPGTAEAADQFNPLLLGVENRTSVITPINRHPSLNSLERLENELFPQEQQEASLTNGINNTTNNTTNNS